jgi:hypothetical protein
MIVCRRPWLLLFALLLVVDLLDQPFRLPFFEPAPSTVALAPQDSPASVDSARALSALSRDLNARPIPLKDAGGVSPALPAPHTVAVHTPPLPWDNAVASSSSSLLSIPLRC